MHLKLYLIQLKIKFQDFLEMLQVTIFLIHHLEGKVYRVFLHQMNKPMKQEVLLMKF